MRCSPAFVVAKDSKRGYVLLGGLGVMGCGEMWFQERADYHNYEGWDGAPEKDSAGDLGGPAL